MGKSLIQQRRGKGSSTFRSPSFRYAGDVKIIRIDNGTVNGKITDIVHSQGHSAPLMRIKYDDGQDSLLQAPEGISVGETVVVGDTTDIKIGNAIPLKNIPEGTEIYNIESRPGDGGKFARTSGVFAKVLSKINDKVTVLLPSSKTKEFHYECKAVIGTIAGSGRTDKPFLKAGKAHFAYRSKNQFWPKVCGVSMNAVNHPFGGRSSAHKGRPTQSARSSPPGRKVGKIAPRRTGRRNN